LVRGVRWEMRRREGRKRRGRRRRKKKNGRIGEEREREVWYVYVRIRWLGLAGARPRYCACPA